MSIKLWDETGDCAGITSEAPGVCPVLCTRKLATSTADMTTKTNLRYCINATILVSASVPRLIAIMAPAPPGIVQSRCFPADRTDTGYDDPRREAYPDSDGNNPDDGQKMNKKDRQNSRTNIDAQHGPDHRLHSHQNRGWNPRMTWPDKPRDDGDKHCGRKPSTGNRQKLDPVTKNGGQGSENHPPDDLLLHGRPRSV